MPGPPRRDARVSILPSQESLGGDPRVSSRKRFRQLRRQTAARLVRWLGSPVLRGLSGTWRMTVLGEENLADAERERRGHFMALWHGRMLLGLPHHGEREWHALVSASQDGEIFSALIERFGYQTIRGSSGSGGTRAVREILAVLERGSVLCITPDGPRGPRHAMHPGLAWLARATGYPVVPVGFACDRAWRLRSWDRFTIPRPGARVVMTYDQPIRVPREAGDAELSSASEAIREGILRAERRGFALLEREPDW